MDQFTCKGPKLLYLYSCIAFPQPPFKLLCLPRASTQGVKHRLASSPETVRVWQVNYSSFNKNFKNFYVWL